MIRSIFIILPMASNRYPFKFLYWYKRWQGKFMPQFYPCTYTVEQQNLEWLYIPLVNYSGSKMSGCSWYLILDNFILTHRTNASLTVIFYDSHNIYIFFIPIPMVLLHWVHTGPYKWAASTSARFNARFSLWSRITLIYWFHTDSLCNGFSMIHQQVSRLYWRVV